MAAVFAPPVRRSRRVPATFPVSLFPQSDSFPRGLDAYTVDISHFGARVRTTYLLSAGEVVGLQPSGDSEKPIPSRVVWVQRSSSGGTLAGLEYLETLPA